MYRSILFCSLLVSGEFASASGKTECDHVLNVVYVLPQVTGSFDPGHLKEVMHVSEGLVFASKEYVPGVLSQAIDIFSTNPDVQVNYVARSQGTYKTVYIRGPRNEVLNHLILINERQAQANDWSAIDSLASKNPNHIEKFIADHPLKTGEQEVEAVVTLLDQVLARRQELAADKELAQFDTVVRLSLSFKDNSAPVIPKKKSWWSLGRQASPPTSFQMLTDYASRLGLAHEVAGGTLNIHFDSPYFSALEEIYRVLRYAKQSEIIPSMLPKFGQALDELARNYPPGANVRSLMEKQTKKVNLSEMQIDPREP